MPQERKDKIGKANKDKKKRAKTEEEKVEVHDRLSKRLKEEWASGKRIVTGMTDKNHSEETKAKISASVIKKYEEKRNGK